MAIWVFYLGGLLLILALYGAKYLGLSRFSSLAAVTLFVLAAVAAVPVTWLLSPDWDKPYVLRIANFVGTPIMVLMVPIVSFVYDLRAKQVAGRFKPALWRLPLELFVAVPIWFVFWIFFEFGVLHWVWI